jgi:hypothetical protein
MEGFQIIKRFFLKNSMFLSKFQKQEIFLHFALTTTKILKQQSNGSKK